jgi:hypothetical protein
MQRSLFSACLLLCSASAASIPVTIRHDSPALEFTYQWPAQAAAIPRLDRRFRREAAREYRRHLKLGREDKQSYIQEQRGSVSDFYSKKWSVAGVSPRLLSLQYQHATYTGGAHPNTDHGALLWDKKLGREIRVDSLFLHASALETVTRDRYCPALQAERRKRRGKGWQTGVAEFNQCPKYSELAIAPVDKDNDGRFDTFAFVASPYVAGPYVEGMYEIAVPVTAKLMAALKPEYRGSFEVQRQ